MAPLLTLDTSCVSAVSNRQPSNEQAEVASLDRILDLARAGRLDLQVTESYYRDFDRMTDDAAVRDRLAWFDTAPEIQVVGGPFRFDVSVLDGRDFFASEADVELDGRLREVLGSERIRSGQLPSHEDDPGAAGRMLSDIDHLLAHAHYSADWFVTLDKGILRKSALLGDLGVRVGLPSEVLAAVSD